MVDFTDLGRSVVFYDQLGCGNSTHLPTIDPTFWEPKLFADELDNLLEALGLSNSYHVLGQSWGGMLAQEHAVRQPSGLRSITLSNTAAAFPHFIAAAQRLVSQLPEEVQTQLRIHEEAQTYTHPDYLAACDVFYRRHVLRLDDWPPEVTRAFALLDEDPTVYHVMNGPSEFHVIGSAKEWSCVDRLSNIQVPALVICGRYDEAAPEIQHHLIDGIRTSELVILENSSHLSFWEERTLYMETVEEFLSRNDG
jgi:L-proline amide hydrolase